jgi:hypothetical protein
MNHYKIKQHRDHRPDAVYMVQEVLVTVLQGLRLSARRVVR